MIWELSRIECRKDVFDFIPSILHVVSLMFSVLLEIPDFPFVLEVSPGGSCVEKGNLT